MMEPERERASCGEWLVFLVALVMLWVGVLLVGVVFWRWVT